MKPYNKVDVIICSNQYPLSVQILRSFFPLVPPVGLGFITAYKNLSE